MQTLGRGDSTISFRPKEGFDDGRDYRLEIYKMPNGSNSGQLTCTLKQTQQKLQVLLPTASGLALLVKALAPVEPLEFVEYLGQTHTDHSSILEEVHFLRLGLKFSFDHIGKRLVSMDFLGYQLASNQQLEMLSGFRGFLLLEVLDSKTSELGRKSPKSPGLVILPKGNLQFRHHESETFLRCTLNFNGIHRKFSLFKIHWEDGNLEIPTTVGRLQLAALLWACSRAEPEPLFGRPARWKALQLLRQSWQNQPYQKDSDSC